jgi:hypothetical protein
VKHLSALVEDVCTYLQKLLHILHKNNKYEWLKIYGTLDQGQIYLEINEQGRISENFLS